MNKTKFSFLVSQILCLFYCDIGPGTSGRDHCKNYKSIQLDGPGGGSRSYEASCPYIYPLLMDGSNTNLIEPLFIDCAIKVSELKKCDNESPLPWPIPVK